MAAPHSLSTCNAYRPHTPITAAQVIRARNILRAGKSLAEAAAAVGVPAAVLDVSLWNALGKRVGEGR